LFSRLIIGVTTLLVVLIGTTGAEAKVFYSRSEALELAFPDADEVGSETFVLNQQQADRIQSIAKCPVESKLVKIYKAVRAGSVIGYALIDVHNVRTLPEAFMVVLTPDGEVRSIRVLAFHEPLEYKPTSRWYSQFDHVSKGAPLRVGRDVHGVVGATLSARATTRGVRRALALYEVLIQNEL